jgi:hypothetical protein
MRLDIRSQGLELGAESRTALERKLHFNLARFCGRVHRVNVCVADLHGAGGDMRVGCQIVVRLVPCGRVRIEVAARNLDTALDWAAQRIGPAVDRELLRWRHGTSGEHGFLTGR